MNKSKNNNFCIFKELWHHSRQLERKREFVIAINSNKNSFKNNILDQVILTEIRLNEPIRNV